MSASKTSTPRVRMFAGPNGSGKSTLKALLRPDLLESYINPDDIEAEIRAQGSFNFREWKISTTERELREFFSASTLLQNEEMVKAGDIPFYKGKLWFAVGEVNSYFASVIADFVRRKLVAKQDSFTFETVMSSPDKINFLREARQNGFRNYLYFVATRDPEINIARVANRVITGGHDVPLDKIISRYHRSLGLLSDAIAATDRAYIFDNSGSQLGFIAEYENGQLTGLKTPTPPRWFEIHVLDKLN